MNKKKSTNKRKSPRALKPKAPEIPVVGEKPAQKHAEVHQLQIFHISDLHFGSTHNFNPDKDPLGKPLPQAGVRSFHDILIDELSEGDENCPTLVAVTGDLTSKNEQPGFDEAARFLKKLVTAKIGGKKRGKGIIAVIPGNHDVNRDGTDAEEKWLRWSKFYNGVFQTNHPASKPLEFVTLTDHEGEGFCVLTLNSEMYVSSNPDDQYRGQIDEEQLEQVRQVLTSNKAKLKSRIKVALIHHHPVLIPQLVEADRNYDAVLRSGQLLNLLNKHGFHLILHGHKHWPCSFPVDVRNAYDKAFVRPLLVVSGGSAGSRELPPGVKENCYNRILVKWNSDTEEMRLQVETRGLQTTDEQGQPHPTRAAWTWSTLRVDDRIFYRNQRIPPVDFPSPVISIDKEPPKFEAKRGGEYARLRGNLPVVEVRPSFEPFQKYEAVFWLAEHPSKTFRPERPVSVKWSAGELFPVLTVTAGNDGRFAGAYSYYGPVLIQATLTFKDGSIEHAYVYARIPSSKEFPLV